MFRFRSARRCAALAGAALTLGLLWITSAPAGDKGNPNPRVMPPQSKAFGASYGEWGGRWWQWAFSFRVADIPFFNTGGDVDIGAGQSGHVWFLAGANNGLTEPRTGSVPSGTALLLPLANLVNDYPCPDPSFQPDPGETLEHFLQRTGDAFMPHLTGLFAEIDGVAVTNLEAYRSISPLFTFTADPALAPDFDPCVTGTEQPGVAVGYWLILAPLPPGQHTLHFGATDWGQDITYILTVTGH